MRNHSLACFGDQLISVLYVCMSPPPLFSSAVNFYFELNKKKQTRVDGDNRVAQKAVPASSCTTI